MIDERWYPDDPDDDDWMSIEEFDDNVAAIAEWARNADRTGTLRKKALDHASKISDPARDAIR